MEVASQQGQRRLLRHTGTLDRYLDYCRTTFSHRCYWLAQPELATQRGYKICSSIILTMMRIAGSAVLLAAATATAQDIYAVCYLRLLVTPATVCCYATGSEMERSIFIHPCLMQDKFVINPVGQADQCLGAEQSTDKPASAVRFSSCDGTDAQLWARVRVGTVLQWQNVASKSCLQGTVICLKCSSPCYAN